MAAYNVTWEQAQEWFRNLFHRATDYPVLDPDSEIDRAFRAYNNTYVLPDDSGNTGKHIMNARPWFKADGRDRDDSEESDLSPSAMTSKHRDHLVDMIFRLAESIAGYSNHGGYLHGTTEVKSVLGIRNGDDLTFHITVNDPDQLLIGAGFEGLSQLGPQKFSFNKAEVAEHLSTVFAQMAIDLTK